jgi:transcriptional regulator GlxA family with amidase domain
MPPIRRILVLAVDGAQSLDIMGPVEVFATAEETVPGSYAFDTVGPATAGHITMSNGLRLAVDPLPEPPPRVDTLIVTGGEGSRRAAENAVVVDWIARASRRARRTTSICTGAYLLAASGRLDGHRATTHWAYCDIFRQRFPEVELDPDPVFIRDGDIWTSAGVTAGIDLALALVEDDLGSEVAMTVARLLVVFLKRPGGQAQFSGALSAQQASRPALRELQSWIASHLDEDLSVTALAARASLSERSFARAFKAEVGQTPAAYVESLRVERARTLLEDGAESLEAVTRDAGFSSAEVLRRAFHRRVGVSPAAYRERFRLAA